MRARRHEILRTRQHAFCGEEAVCTSNGKMPLDSSPPARPYCSSVRGLAIYRRIEVSSRGEAVEEAHPRIRTSPRGNALDECCENIKPTTP
jgi:hypothetical protein